MIRNKLFYVLMMLSLFSAADIKKQAEIMNKQLSEWQKDGPKSSKVLRVVYFTPKDKAPAKDYQKRWNAILKDFESFFAVEMKRNGFGNKTISLEKEGENIKLHVVQGKSNDDGTYSYKSGGLIRKEVKEALAAKGIDMAQETVLIVNNLSKVEKDKVTIYSPFYGQGANQKYGVCHAMDCELLSVEGLRDSKTKIMVKEHGDFKPFTMAKFNTTYIGGTIHELGHGLSLPHNKATSHEKHLGTALMGSGNYTYRKEWLNEGKGTFLTFAHALRLATHPLFSGSQKDREREIEAHYSKLKIEYKDNKIHIKGALESNIPACGILAYNDAKGRSKIFQVNNDYDAKPWTSAINEKGEFSIAISDLAKGMFQIRLVAVFNNGATKVEKFHYFSEKKDSPDLKRANQELSSYFRNRIMKPVLLKYASGDKSSAAKMAREVLKAQESKDILERLNYLIELCENPKSLKNLEQVPAETKKVFLSDYKWASAKVGWRRPIANQYRIQNNRDSNVFLEIKGQFYKKGFYAHSPSNYTYELAGKWKELSTSFGFRDGGNNNAYFIIKGDGKVLYKSPETEPEKVYSKTVNVEGVKKLELIVEPVETNSSSWTIWVNPELSR